MFLKNFPPVSVIGGYKYYSYCPVCGCIANYKIGYNYISICASSEYRIYSWVCLDCSSEHCFNKYNSCVKEHGGV